MTSENIKLLKKKFGIISVANRLGLSNKHLDENSDSAVCIHCPNSVSHKNGDKIPSFALLPRYNKYHCYSCNIEGDVINLVQLIRNCSFLEAIEWLDPTFNLYGGKYPKAKEYLRKKGFSKETIEKFQIFTGTTKYENQTYECVYFPVSNGKKYRLIDCEFCKYRYTKGTKTTLFKTIKNPEDKKVVLCEGEFDALSGWQNTGYVFWTSTGGAATFYKNWVNDFIGLEEIIVGYDNDHPGREGAKKTIETLIENGIDPKKIIQIEVPEILGKDWSDYFAAGMGKKDFDELINNSRPP